MRSFRDDTRAGQNGVGFSVQTAPGTSIDELARGGQFPNRQISVSTVGRLQAIPGVVINAPTPGFGAYHGTVNISYPPTPEVFYDLCDAFILQPNPHVFYR